jgi:hypothetical protein
MPLKFVSTKSSLFAALVLGVALGPLAASQQPAWKPFTERRPYLDPRAALNKDAEATYPNGIHFYAEDLAHYLMPDKAGEEYINSFADRLATAEQEARDGKRKLIPDAVVLKAFYKVMKRANPPTMADLAALRRFRTDPRLDRQYPALFTADRNGTHCYPGEAVFLLATMLQGDEWRMNIAPSVPPPAPSSSSLESTPYVYARRVDSMIVAPVYMMQNPHDIQKVFNRVAKILDI